MASVHLAHSVDEDMKDFNVPTEVTSKKLDGRQFLAVASGSSHLVVILNNPNDEANGN